MANTDHPSREPNEALIRIFEESAASKKSLAHSLNKLCEQAGCPRTYTNTSISNWMTRGMIPQPPVPRLLAQVLTARLGRTVSIADIGMSSSGTTHADMGLEFPREPGDAVRTAAEYWSAVKRRTFTSTTAAFAIAAYATPVTRWLISPADQILPTLAGRRVGQADIDELREIAEDARCWDARYGGGNWKLSSVNDCLHLRAAPLLHGSYSEAVGRQLFTVTAELSRLAGWSAFDMGHHDTAQRYFIQGLRMAKAGADRESGCYVLTTMALQSLIRGFPNEAIDMAQGAFNSARHVAAERVLSFAKLAEARAHAKAGNGPAAERTLRESEDLLAAVRNDGSDPAWLEYYTPARLASDAVEIYRDLGKPRKALEWSGHADAMPSGRFTRATGIRLSVASTAHLQQGDLDRGLEVGHRALAILGGVESARAHDYLRRFVTDLAPWRNETRVTEFIQLTPRAVRMST
ncbi:hypothetical protein P3T36_007217 [Kitasatospora sp. MAP12-15]|uniref:sporulation protein n=1 Tax=unclassified Kitasatospora TaxID=2633591 RepID=UPI002474CB15|nr:sporulation protein [Kitasatospora sp. MAP12-44]MDH6113695.1 hypothetical protein [Kitasatospora sp. MAP12-44]